MQNLEGGGAAVTARLFACSSRVNISRRWAVYIIHINFLVLGYKVGAIFQQMELEFETALPGLEK